jgi:hypothetical protein
MNTYVKQPGGYPEVVGGCRPITVRAEQVFGEVLLLKTYERTY